MPDQSSPNPGANDQENAVGASSAPHTPLPTLQRNAEQRKLITSSDGGVAPVYAASFTTVTQRDQSQRNEIIHHEALQGTGPAGKKVKKNSLGEEDIEELPPSIHIEPLSEKFSRVATLPPKDRIPEFFKLVDSTSRSNAPHTLYDALRHTESKLGRPLPFILLDESVVSKSVADAVLNRYFSSCCDQEDAALQRQLFAEYVSTRHDSKIQSLLQASIQQTAHLESLFEELDKYRLTVVEQCDVLSASGVPLISANERGMLRSIESHNPLLIELLEKVKTSYVSLVALGSLSIEHRDRFHNLFKEQDLLLFKIAELKESITAIESAIVAEKHKFARLYERFVAKELPNRKRSNKSGIPSDFEVQYHSPQSITDRKSDHFTIHSDETDEAELTSVFGSKDIEPILEDEKTPFEMRTEADKERSIAEDCARRFVLSGDFANAEASITAYNNRFPQFQISSDFLGPLKEKILRRDRLLTSSLTEIVLASFLNV